MIEPIKVIGQILKEELGLAEGRIMLENQEYAIPEDKDLFIELSYLGPGNVLASASRPFPTDAGMSEMQEVLMRHIVNIELMSFGPDARLRKEEVAMALRSVRSQQLQAENSISIARNPGPPLNISGVEGSSRLNRYAISVPVQAVHRKIKPVPYFTDFSTTEELINA